VETGDEVSSLEREMEMNPGQPKSKMYMQRLWITLIDSLYAFAYNYNIK